jgi:DNA repair exonuclease SbcCD ATPase subunit
MARTEVPKMKDEVAAAREMVARAEAAHAREVERLAEARREIDRVAAELQSADPDDPRFMKLTGERSTARARADTLAERESRARAALNQAKERVAEVERDQKRACVADLDAKIRAADAAITTAVLGFYEDLLAKIREVRKLAADANAIESDLGTTRGPYADGARGSRWVAGPLNKSVLRWAIGALPDSVPGEEA